MKKSVTIWILEGGVDGSLSIVEGAKKIRDAGFDAVELSFNKKGELSFDTSYTTLQTLHDKFERIGIEISSISTLMLNEYSITAKNQDEREYALKIVNRMLEIANLMRIPTVQISPGKVDFDNNYKAVYERSLEECGKLANRAEELGVTLVIENDWNKFLLSPLEFRNFLDQIDSKYLAACLDTRNTYLNGYPHHWIEVLEKKIKKIHLTDLRKIRNVFTEFCDIGDGDIDLCGAVKELKKIHYDGYATIEVFHRKNDITENRLQELSGRLDRLLRMV